MNEHILIIGGGSIGERHLINFLRHDGVRCSVADPDAARLELLQREHPLQAAHADWETVDLGDIDGVVICTPTNMHVPMLLQLAGTDVGILCEKPLAMSLEGLDELAAKLAQHNTQVGVAFCFRHDPLMEELRQRIQERAFGHISHVIAMATHYWPDMRSPWPPLYAMRRETGGGVIQDHAVHFINLLEWFFGPTDSVSALQRHVQLADVPTEDFGTVTLRFGGGQIGVLTVCVGQRNPQGSMEVAGSDATARYDQTETQLQIYRGDTRQWETGTATRAADRNEKYHRQAGHFLACLRGESEPRCTFAEAAQTLNTVLAATASSDTTGGFIDVEVDDCIRTRG